MDLISSEGYSRMSACLKPLEVVQKRNKLALELDNNTGGQCTRKLINEWDKNCLANHIYCGQASDSAFLPTRLLEINDVGNPTTCRLVLREEVPCASRYTALSYRWGVMKTKGETRLLESTFDTMRTGLPLSSLPKTYVDAIDVTSWLDTGEVTGGQLELRGPWVTIVTTGKKGILDNNNFLAHFQYLDPSSALEKPLVIETDDSVYHDTEIIYDTQDDMVKQAFCMPICTWRNELPTWHFRGIVLVPVEDGGFNYRRIGLVDGFFKTEEEAHTFFSQFPRRSVTVT
ncbi:uncharacterized protein J4E92_004909 [Alternaria infectoria]|uniref:uncharacterized protein n=1 Tax=Alternaria infectoria TaxID=45303 RepID=UPI00221F9F12|nr:uncharacterized protein J4E92_004909 [Alternaria infectoria]KAI4929245.1 hypothetical protein J4E92_004909 [Alternaria infectoria]